MKNHIRHHFLLQTVLASTVFLSLILSLILSMSLVFFSPAYAQAGSSTLHVNLQEYPLYLKRGFDAQNTVQPDVNDGSWLKKFPFSNVIISKLELSGLPERIFLSPFAKPEEEFTFLIPFKLNGVNRLATESMPGLFLAAISDNWQVYLNGVLVRSELFLEGASLRIQTHRSKRNVFFPLPVHLLKEGDNLLAFRIVGDPTDKTVGFQYSSPFYIGDYDDMQTRHSETVTMILIGGYLLLGMYYFLLFVIRSKDAYNMYCGAFSVLMGFYVFFRTHSIYSYIADTALIVKLEFFCAFMLIPVLGAFAQTLCSGKISVITKIYSAVFAFFALSQLVLPRPYGSDALTILQVTGIAALLYILIDNVILVFIREVRTQSKQYVLRGAKVPSIGYFLIETYSGNLLLAVGTVVAGILVDIVDSLFFHYVIQLSRYSFYVFMMTVTLMLARMYGKLNNSLEAKSIFLANMSHEIRTPLNAIMGMVEQIVRADPPEAIRVKTEHIKQAGGILLSIINDILDFSCLEAGKTQIVNREYHFLSLINEVTGIVGVELANKDIQFVIETNPAIPQTLIGDAPRIRQILFNMLWNAVKFTNHGKIEFRADRKDQGNTLTIVFSVSDTGMGIKPENMTNIFTEFYRLDSRGRLNTEGTGLGLTICKNLCQLMGGEIGVQSEYGKGSTFTVTLPQQLGTGEMVPEVAKEPTLLERGITLPAVLVLIVDDLPSNRQVMAGLLKPYGMEIHAAANGREALERAASLAYDLVFMDHVMDDDMDGVAAMLALRKVPNHAETPVVAVSAHAMTGMREFFLGHGFIDYISKPIDPFLLDSVIAKCVPKEQWLFPEEQGVLPKEQGVLLKEQQLLPEENNVGQAGSGLLAESSDSLAPSVASKSSYAGAVQSELLAQRINILHHYRWHFASELAADSVYCENFAVLLEELLEVLPEASATLQTEITTLVQAGRQGDLLAIKEHLPSLCAALRQEAESAGTLKNGRLNLPLGQEEGSIYETLAWLKKALDSGDIARAEKIMAELRELPWSKSLGNETRELYFLLYDALMVGETEKAAGALAMWSKIFRHQE